MKTYRVKVKQVYVETMFIEAESEDEANNSLNQMCEQLLANPVIEDFEIIISND